MTQSLKIATLLLVAQLIFSCNKDKCSGRKKNSAHCDELVAVSHPTIFPLSYLPVYPGSYWKYENSLNGEITTKKTNTTYLKDLNRTSFASKADTFYVPYYEDEPIWGYSSHSTNIDKYGNYPFMKILSDSLHIGAFWSVSYTGVTHVMRKVRVRDTTIVIKGQSFYPTIVMRDYYESGPPKKVRKSESYYTKDIGLVMYNTFGGYPYDTLITSSVLVDYFINK